MNKCPNCGAPLDVKDPSNVRMLYCEHCSSQIDMKSEEHRVLTNYSQKPSPPKSALRLGAKDVFLIYRRTWAQMPAEEDEKTEAEKEGVQFLLLNQPLEYLSDSSGAVSGVKLIRTRLGDPDESGRRRPVEIPGSEWNLEADMVVEAIGNKAEEGSKEWYSSVKTDGKNLVVVDGETGATNVKGIFAGGDIVRGPALVVEAVQDGKVAAAAIAEYLGMEA